MRLTRTLITSCIVAWTGLASAQIATPVLKWQQGGCFSSYCETGWYSSPALIDLDGDGIDEVVASAYSVVALEGVAGTLIWRAPSGHDSSNPSLSSAGRTWPGICIADIDNDGVNEIVTAHGGGYVSAYDRMGHFKPGWPFQVAGGAEFRSLSVADIDGDRQFEIIAGRAAPNALNTWVLSSAGAIRAGWPQPTSTTSGYSWGVYNANIAVGNITGDGALEIVVPSDVHYVCAYHPDGTSLDVNAMYAPKTAWGLIPAYVAPAIELQGYGDCGVPAEAARANFADGPASIADLDGDGVPEIVVVGNVYDCGTNDYLYDTPFIFNPDRSRYNKTGRDWTTPPVNTGAPLTLDYNIIENAAANPALADLDGDGIMEIVFASYDGRVHAFWLDKTEHGNWPFSVYRPAEGFFRFASEPVIADLDGDGKAEVVFTSWTQKGSGTGGKLHIVDFQGNVIRETALPTDLSSGSWDGALAAPTLGDIDGDADLEIIINTANSGCVAYDLPGTSRARVLWGTGRGNFGRTGLAQPEPPRAGVVRWGTWR